MGNAPSLRNVETKYGGEPAAGFRSHGVPPGAEGHQQFSAFVKGHVTMHHTGKSQGSQLGQGHTVLVPYVLFQTLIAALQPFPDILQTVGPDVVFQTVFPIIGAHGHRLMGCVHQHCLDTGGAELNTQHCLSGQNRFLTHVYPPVFSFSLGLEISHAEGFHNLLPF